MDISPSLIAKYTPVPNDLGMFQGPGLTMAPPQPGCGGADSMQAVLRAGLSAGRVPASYNPSGQLYSRGTSGLTLEAPTSTQCDPGCLGIHSDPRNPAVKPLYQGHVYKLAYMPTATNVVGMYP